MMKKLTVFVISLLLPFLAHAEVWKDYTPSEQVTELVVMDVKSNYLDDYLMNLKTTWAASMDVLKEKGYIVDYGIWVANASASPNVFLTTTFENMGAMQGSKERYDAMTKALDEMGMDEDKNDKTAKGYEDIRKVVDYKVISRITYN